MSKSKFYKPVPFKEKLIDFLQSLLFWRGRTKGMIHTMDIKVSHIYRCFFPKKGNEYSYLGYAYYYSKESPLRDFFIEVDKVARPRWCPKFFLRLLDLFGNDNSIVRVRNRKLHNLFNKITKGIRIHDTKWKYDTYRIYGNFTKELDDLADETCIKMEKL